MSEGYVADRRRVVGLILDRAGRSITLIPRTQTATSDGGFVWTEGTPRTPQIFRPPHSTADATRIEESVSGVQRETLMVIDGAYDATVEVHDVFDLDGYRWEVVQVLPPTGWWMRAEVVRLG